MTGCGSSCGLPSGGPRIETCPGVPAESAPQAASAFYYARRKPYDLSLGDALCLGMAEALGADVLTAERGWATIPDLPFSVTLIRS